LIIADAGKNFIQTEEEKSTEEYLENAKEIVDKAIWAGADVIKWQTHNVEDEQVDMTIDSPHAKDLDRYKWTTRNTNSTPVETFWKPLREYCDQKGIAFLSTPMSRGAAERLTSAGSTFWKIGSGDILDFVMMDYLRNSGKPVIMSSGMSTFEEVKKGINFLKAKNNRVALMHCLSKYPGAPEEANLSVSELYRETFPGTPIGFSENSLGIEPSCIAVAFGATIVEKHFTLDRAFWGPDHKVASTPEEFKTMVGSIRAMENSDEEKRKWLSLPNIKAVLGDKEKKLNPDEEPLRPIWRKALVAGADVPAGTVVTASMIYALRPQAYVSGLASERYEEVLGRKTKKDLKKFDPITEDVLE